MPPGGAVEQSKIAEPCLGLRNRVTRDFAWRIGSRAKEHFIGQIEQPGSLNRRHYKADSVLQRRRYIKYLVYRLRVRSLPVQAA